MIHITIIFCQIWQKSKSCVTCSPNPASKMEHGDRNNTDYAHYYVATFPALLDCINSWL
jgi:hypothetical protein